MVNMMVELNKYKSRNLNSYNPYTDTFNHKRICDGDGGYSYIINRPINNLTSYENIDWITQIQINKF